MITVRMLCCAAFGVLASAPALGTTHVVNEGTRNWIAAARTGRADMLIWGDSMVLHGGHGWDAGYNAAFSERLGLAGTGLATGIGGEGEGFSTYAISGWSPSPADVRSDRQGYVWRGHALTAGASGAGQAGFSIGGTTLPPNSAYRADVWAAPADDANGALGMYRRLDYSPYTTLASAPTRNVTLPVAGLHRLEYDFGPNDAAGAQGFVFRDASDVSILYGRLSRPGATGVTVSSWGYGGRSTLDFVRDKWDGEGMTTAGRTAWLDALTYGGSGKLNVLIAEGFNDRNETETSLGGNADGNSADAFEDNTRALIGRVRSAWATAGRDGQDLSFTLVSAYKDYHDASANGTGLAAYAAVYREIAEGDAQISFVDLYAMSPDWSTANADGYMVDEVHASYDGTLAYSAMVADVLVPEPATATVALLACHALALLRPRRR